MAKKKPKPGRRSTAAGTSSRCPMWDEDYLNEEVQAFIEFDDKGGGSFQFGYVQGIIDCRETPAGR